MRILYFELVCMMTVFFSFPLMAEKVNTEKVQFRSSNAAPVKKDNLYFSLTATDGSFDRFYLAFADEYSEGYKASEDAVTQSTYYNSQPALYCLQDGTDQALALNGLPMKDNRYVKVGFSVPEAGTYTLNLEVRKKTDLRSVELIDNLTGKKINLRQTSYTFTTTDRVMRDNSRFTLIINLLEADPENTLPGGMIVAGKMHIGGTMRSEGAVHILAANAADTGKVDIDNTSSGAILAADVIYLYSNDLSDGLLRNMNEKGGGVKGINDAGSISDCPKQVTLRKSLADASYTYLSLPFHVTAENVTHNGTQLKGGDTGGDYWGVEFAPQVRSDESTVEAGKTFVEMDYTHGFAKGTGYAVYYDFGNSGEPRAYMDFTTIDNTEIKNLFNPDDKKVKYPVHSVDPNAGWKNPEYGDGWAFIGGLNSTTYTLSADNIKDYGGSAVWYRDEKTAQAMGTQHNQYKSIILSNEALDLGPYTPFWIQDVIVTHGSVSDGYFTFKKLSGLSIESAQFRSVSENTAKDRLYFALSDDNNDTFDRFYVVFADDYSESYKASEDAVTMATSCEDSPAVWSLQDGTNRGLTLNGLPMKDERAVRMGFSVPDAGDYTLKLNALKLTDVRNVILADNVTGKTVDLLQTSYSFSTSEKIENENNRFVLHINSSYTDIPAIASDRPFAYTKDNLLTIKNLSEGNAIQVYDLAGRTIVSGQAAGKEFSTVLSQKGVYVINIKGEKTTVLKVLNK